MACFNFFKTIGFLTRIDLNTDPNPAIFSNADPDPGFAITAEVETLHFFFPLL
jgi:hypothetical protein